MNPDLPILLDTPAAARLLGLSPSTLEKWRFFCTPTAPPVVRIGRTVRYDRRALEAWIAAKAEEPQ